MSTGISSVISIKKEDSYGVAVVPNVSIPVRPTGGIEIKKNVQMLQAIKGQSQHYYESIPGKCDYSGDYEFDCFADIVGHFLYSAFGKVTPTLHASESLVYDHTFEEQVSKQSYTIEENLTENCRRFAGALVSGFKLTGKPQEMLLFTPSILAKTQAPSTAITASFGTVPAFNFAQLAVKLGGSLLTAECENIEIDYKNGLEMLYALGSTDPVGYSIKGGSEISIKLDLILDATSLTRMTNYLADTKESIELIATGGAIGNASHYGLDLKVFSAVYNSAVTKITDQHNVLSLQADGIYSTSDSKMLSCILTNLVSAY